MTGNRGLERDLSMAVGAMPTIGSDAEPEVGEFRAGNPISQWALSRYLVGQAIGADVSRGLLLGALLFGAVAALVGWTGPTWGAVLLGLSAVGLLLMRVLLDAVLRRLTADRRLGALRQELRSLVAATRGDVRRELRRIGVPSRPWTMPLLAWRLAGRRREETFSRLRQFEVNRVVPPARLDQLHLLLLSDRRRYY
jgi:hypothetical protein